MRCQYDDFVRIVLELVKLAVALALLYSSERITYA